MQSTFTKSTMIASAMPESHPHLFDSYSTIKSMVAKGFEVGNTPTGDIDESFDFDTYVDELFLTKVCDSLVTLKNISELPKADLVVIFSQLHHNPELVVTITNKDKYKYTLYEPCCFPDDICRDILNEIYNVSPSKLNTVVHLCTEVTSVEDSDLHTAIKMALDNDLVIPLDVYGQNSDIHFGLDTLIDNNNCFNKDIRYRENPYEDTWGNICFGLKLQKGKLKIVAWSESR